MLSDVRIMTVEFIHFDKIEKSSIYRLTINDPEHLETPIALDLIFLNGELQDHDVAGAFDDLDDFPEDYEEEKQVL